MTLYFHYPYFPLLYGAVSNYMTNLRIYCIPEAIGLTVDPVSCSIRKIFVTHIDQCEPKARRWLEYLKCAQRLATNPGGDLGMEK